MLQRVRLCVLFALVAVAASSTPPKPETAAAGTVLSPLASPSTAATHSAEAAGSNPPFVAPPLAQIEAEGYLAILQNNKKIRESKKTVRATKQPCEGFGCGAESGGCKSPSQPCCIQAVHFAECTSVEKYWFSIPKLHHLDGKKPGHEDFERFHCVNQAHAGSDVYRHVSQCRLLTEKNPVSLFFTVAAAPMTHKTTHAKAQVAFTPLGAEERLNAVRDVTVYSRCNFGIRFDNEKWLKNYQAAPRGSMAFAVFINDKLQQVSKLFVMLAKRYLERPPTELPKLFDEWHKHDAGDAHKLLARLAPVPKFVFNLATISKAAMHAASRVYALALEATRAHCRKTDRYALHRFFINDPMTTGMKIESSIFPDQHYTAEESKAIEDTCKLEPEYCALFGDYLPPTKPIAAAPTWTEWELAFILSPTSKSRNSQVPNSLLDHTVFIVPSWQHYTGFGPLSIFEVLSAKKVMSIWGFRGNYFVPDTAEPILLDLSEPPRPADTADPGLSIALSETFFASDTY